MTKNIVYYSGVYWPKNPYFEINFVKYLKKKNKDWNIKLLLNEDDVRLKGIQNKKTLNSFDKNIFNNKKVIKLKKYEDLIDLTNNIDLFIGSNQITDRRKITIDELFNYVKCKKLIIDLYGYDTIKKNFCDNADYIFVKGEKLKKWLNKDNINKEKIFVTGSPYFDYYKKNNFKNFDVDKNSFFQKYNLNIEKQTICLTTTNLCSSRIKMNEQNLNEFIKFYQKFKNKYNFILLSYPNDYLYYEISKKYIRSNIDKEEQPDYQFIKNKIKNLEIIECQDNINALHFCNKVFHLSVGALSSEILFYFWKMSYTMNFVDKDFYLNKVGYSKHIRFPDDICNINLKNIYDLDKDHNIDIKSQRKLLNDFFLHDDCHKNVNDKINQILN